MKNDAMSGGPRGPRRARAISIAMLALLTATAVALGVTFSAQAATPLFSSPSTCDPTMACCAGGGGPGSTCGGGGPASLGNTSGTNQGAGNPINLITGNKYQREIDLPALPGVLGLEIVRHYNSMLSGTSSATGIFGRGWRLSYDTELSVNGNALDILQADGASLHFEPHGSGLYRALTPGQGRVVARKTRAGLEHTWIWADGRQMLFDTSGHLVQIVAPTGEFVSLQRDPRGWLVRVTDPQGRSLQINYLDRKVAQADGRNDQRFRGVQSIDSPVGRFVYHYNDRGSQTPPEVQSQLAAHRIEPAQLLANLVAVDLPTHYDSAQKAHPHADRGVSSSSVSRLYHYEDPRRPTLLTGITVRGQGADEQVVNERVSTWAYDAFGRANLSAKGAPARLATNVDGQPLQPRSLVPGTGLDQVTLAWPVAGKTVLSNGAGEETVYTHGLISGAYRLLEVRGAGCPSCGETNVRYGYDGLGRLTGTTRLGADGRPLWGEVSELDALGRTVRAGDVDFSSGKPTLPQWRVRYEYPPDGRDEQGNALPEWQPTLIARPSVMPGREYKIHVSYNDAGQPATVSEEGFGPLDAEGRSDGSGMLIHRVTTYGYQRINGRSLLVEIDGPLPNGPLNSPADSDITRYAWDSRGDRLIGITQPMGSTARFAYDEAGRVRQRIGIDGVVERLGYDTLGHLVRLEQGGRVLGLVYDAAGRVSQANDALGQRLSLRHDAAGHLLELRDTQGNRIAWNYEANGAVRDMQLLNPDGSLSQRRLADREQVDKDPADGVRGFLPDLPAAAALWMPAVLRDKALQPVHGVRTALDSQAGITTYRYDDFGRMVAEESPVTGRSLYRYDASDHLVERIASDASHVRIRFDAAGRPVHVVADGEDARIEWARANKPARITYLEGEERFEYNAGAQLVSHTRIADGKTWVTRYEFDAAGRTVRKILPDGQKLAYRYNGSVHGKPGVLAGIDRDGLLPTPIVAGLNADDERFADRGFVHGNGLSHRRVLDEDGRPVSVGSRAAAYSELRWGDGATPTSAVGDSVHVDYRQPLAPGQSAPAEAILPLPIRMAFQLSQLGTRPASGGEGIAALMAPASRDQRFDGRGRLVEDNRLRYVWDGLNRLTEVRLKGQAGTDQPLARYRYNLFGERIAKVVYGGQGQKLSYFFYDGAELTAEADDNGGVTRQYVHLEGRPVAMLSGRSILAIHSDHRLAPLAVTDTDRQVVWQARLSDNGLAEVAAGSSIELPLRGSNQYYDAETGLHYNIQRYLDAGEGRYISPDPMGLAAGPDLYQFALGQPHRFVDPLGLQPSTPAKDWSKASYGDKLGEIVSRAIPLVPGEIGAALQDMVKPENLAVMAAVFAGFVAMQATPIGWIADLALIGYSAWMVGSGITELIKTFIALDSDVSRAKCDADLDAAAKRLAKGFVTGGGEVVGGLAGVWGVKSSGGVTRIAEGIRTLIEFGKKNFARTLPPTVVIEGGVGATPPTPPLKAGLGGTVDQAETGVQWGKGIQGQGNPFENWVQAQLKKLFPSVEQTPGNFPTIDHIDRVSKTVWSTKTMDTVGGYKDPKNIYSTLKGYVDKLAEFPKDGKPVTYAGMTVNPSEVATRKLVLGIPAGTSAAQWAELSRAIQYASSQGIELIVTVLKP